MKIELYQAETTRICLSHLEILEEARNRLIADDTFTELEQKGLIHTIQVLIENAIGKGKHILKFLDQEVPVSGYNVFELLYNLGKIEISHLKRWEKIIGLRNTIVHEYMKVNMDYILKIIEDRQYNLITEFLKKPFKKFS